MRKEQERDRQVVALAAITLFLTLATVAVKSYEFGGIQYACIFLFAILAASGIFIFLFVLMLRSICTGCETTMETIAWLSAQHRHSGETQEKKD